jgi:DMSO/TMAO reductase YedYZ molybdopterin-dependent catalytic subunit
VTDVSAAAAGEDARCAGHKEADPMRITEKALPAMVAVALALSAVTCVKKAPNQDVYDPVQPSPTGEIEATEFLGQPLTPIRLQRNNALKGTQFIDRATYKLTVDGLVDQPLTLTYDQLLAYPEVSKLMMLRCVVGWDFVAKWTGPFLSSILDEAKVRPEATVAIFYTADVPATGYTSLPVSFIRDRNVIIALRLNDVTLPANRGFPFQVIAESKYGYKWAKWVTRIELSSNAAYRGYWESNGYDNNGDMQGVTLNASAPLMQSFAMLAK